MIIVWGGGVYGEGGLNTYLYLSMIQNIHFNTSRDEVIFQIILGPSLLKRFLGPNTVSTKSPYNAKRTFSTCRAKQASTGQSLLLPHPRRCNGRFVHANCKLVNASYSNDCNLIPSEVARQERESNLRPLPPQVCWLTNILRKGAGQ